MPTSRTAAIFCGLFCFTVFGFAQDKKPSVFDGPAQLAEYRKLQRDIAVAFKDADLELALELTQKTIELSPFDPVDHYNHACALARSNNVEAALKYLRKSVELGMLNTQPFEKDTDLESLRKTDEYEEIIKLAKRLASQPFERYKDKLTPYPIANLTAMIAESNTAWDARSATFYTRFKMPDKPYHPITWGSSEIDSLLKEWYALGKAAGNHGDLYDNRDRSHSPLELSKFPQFTRLVYGAEAKARKLDMGAQMEFSHQGVVLGNSSTAGIHPIFWRSQTRNLYSQPGGALQMARQYQTNHLYCYPEHHDHDVGHNGGESAGFGDVFPANTPYVVISQGSSYTDKPFMEAIAATMAAFQPETKQKLIKTGGLMPAIQMILRSSNPELTKPEEYLTGKAHPTAFDTYQLDPLAMVKKANQIDVDKLPPRVAIRVLREESSNYQNNYRLIDTPQAVARVFHTHRGSIKLVVSAQQSKDPNGGEMKLHWRVLRGDKTKIKIQPLDKQGVNVGVTIPYHERMPVAEGSALQSNRVDIGVFVENEHHYSAPAFISVYFPDNQKRVYDAEDRIQSIDFNDPEVRDNYVDPQLYPSKDWRDEFQYTDDQKLKGWRRIRGEGEAQTIEEFTAEGLLVIEKDAEGNPVKTQSVQYRIEQASDQKLFVRQVAPETNDQSTNKQ